MSDSLLTQKLEESKALNSPNGFTSLEAAVEVLAESMTGLLPASGGATASKQDAQSTILGSIQTAAELQSGNDWFTPVEHDQKVFTYVGSGAANDDNVQTIVYKLSGSTVSTLTFAYVGSTNNVQSITKS